jgi:hypothetical protein
MDTRHCLTAPEWETILLEQAQSGMSASGFCKERGIKVSSFFSALKRHKVSLCLPSGEDLSSAVKANRPARPVVGGTSRPATGFVAVQLAVRQAEAAGQDAAAIRVQLRSGHQLWVGPGFDAVHLGRLVAALEPTL